MPTYNDVPLPTEFTEHEGRISGLALLKGNLLASSSFDKTLRIWDLTTMKPVAVRSGAGLGLWVVSACGARGWGLAKLYVGRPTFLYWDGSGVSVWHAPCCEALTHPDLWPRSVPPAPVPALPPLLSPQCVFNAHDSPLQCLEYCEERDELATCAMGNKVKIWNVKRPAQVRTQVQGACIVLGTRCLCSVTATYTAACPNKAGDRSLPSPPWPVCGTPSILSMHTHMVSNSFPDPFVPRR